MTALVIALVVGALLLSGKEMAILTAAIARAIRRALPKRRNTKEATPCESREEPHA